ncbi:MAG TPA: 8-amino-7-oxononanoate synthase, partial [Planctomycetaceae bacterium]|nr:8-amino-7-oxononanoate synthase [Planctomycetaceae bacterium]
RMGRGACEHARVEDRVLARIGTMSKAMGGMGGFVAGSESLTQLLRNTARTQFFSTALPPVVCERMTDSIRTIQNDAAGRQRLQQLTQFAHEQIGRLSLASVPGGIAPIVPIIVEGNEAVTAAAERLADVGFFIPAIRSPTVKAGTERLRMSLTVNHSEEQIATALRHMSVR